MSKIKPTCPYCGTNMRMYTDLRACWYRCSVCMTEAPDGIDAEEALLKALHRASPWHSVKDGLPDTDRDVLVACRSKSGAYNIDKGYSNGERMVHRGHAEATHWMELPDPPKEDDHA